MKKNIPATDTKNSNPLLNVEMPEEEALRLMGENCPPECENKMAWIETLVRELSARKGISNEHLIRSFEEGLGQNDQLQRLIKEQMLKNLINHFSTKEGK